jgi:hypothetical protein
MLTAGSNITLTYNDVANTLTVAASGAGGSTNLDGLTDVAITSPVTGHVLRHNGTQFVNDLGTTHFAAASHTHTIANVTNLQTTLDGKAARDTVTLNTDSATGINLFALTDIGDVVLFTGGTAVTAEIPQQSSVSWPAGARIDCVQMGVGVVTVTAGTGVTLRARGSRVKSAGQYACFSLLRVNTNEWVVAGDLTTV